MKRRSIAARATIGSFTDFGSEVSWTNNTYFDTWTSQTAATSDLPTTGLPGSNNQGWRSNNLLWVPFYAHQAITLAADATNRWGYVALNSGGNSVALRYAVSTTPDTFGSFAADAIAASAVTNFYTAATLFERTITTTVTVSANHYFLLGIVGGPFSKVFKELSTNRTAYIGSSPAVTVLNQFYWGGWTTGPTTGIPTQLGGDTTFTEKLGYVPLLSFKFGT